MKKKVIATVILTLIGGLGIFFLAYPFLVSTWRDFDRMARFMQIDLTRLVACIYIASIILIILSIIGIIMIWRYQVKFTYEEYKQNRIKRKKEKLLEKQNQLQDEINKI